MRWLLTVAVVLAAGCELVFPLDGQQTSCVGLECLTPLAPNEVGATEVAAEGNDLFWTTATAVRTCSIDACDPHDLVAGKSSPHNLIIDGDYVLFATANDMFWTPRAGTKLQLLLADAAAVESFVRLDSRIWWTNRIVGPAHCNYEPVTGDCTSGTTAGNVSQVIGALATDVTGHVWGAAQDGILQIDTVDDIKIKEFTSQRPVAIATSTTHVFSLSDGGTQVLSWPLTADSLATPTPLFDVAAPLQLLTTAKHVYVVDGGGSILRLELLDLGGTVEPIATGLPGLRTIAIDRNRVFAILGNQIVSLPEP